MRSQQSIGINISEHQRDIDFCALKGAGLLFLYHTASTGNVGRDSMYLSRRDYAKLYRIPFGAIHQARPTKNYRSATSQAEHFAACADFKPGDLLPAVAIYESENMSTWVLERWLRRFCRRVERLTGQYPIILSPTPFTASVRGLRWYPHHVGPCPEEVRSAATMWQYSGRVPGVRGFVGVSEFMEGTTVSSIKTGQEFCDELFAFDFRADKLLHHTY